MVTSLTVGRCESRNFETICKEDCREVTQELLVYDFIG